MGKEINNVTYGAFLNVDYLPESDLYVYKQPHAKYKVNVIGAGMIAHEHMLVTMLEGRAEIHGIYDVSEHSIRRATTMWAERYPTHTLKVYDSLQAACNDPDVEALLICTPNYTHMSVVREAVKSGKHIMMEKPMVTTIEDAFEMRELVSGYKPVFQVGLQYRYKAIYAQARQEALEVRALGDVHTISIVEHRVPFLDKIKQWNKFSDYSGGTLVEKCCHYFDLFNLFSDSKPAYVYAVGGQAVNFVDFEYDGKKSDILDHALVTVVYENGVKCLLNLCMFAPMFYEELTICGSEGWLRAYENEDYLPDARPQTHLEILTADHRPSRISTPCYPKTIQSSGHMGGTYFAHKYFVDNMDGVKTDSATVEEGFWSVVVGIAAERAVRTGGVVHISDLLAGR